MAPTAADVRDSGPGRGTFLLDTATVAIVAFGVLALALGPARSGDVGTASATTVAMIDAPALVTPLTIETPNSSKARSVALAPFTQTPRHVASASTPNEAPHAATALPDPDDPVLVLTDDMVYRLPWGALSGIDLPDGAIVIDLMGGLIGHVDDDVIVAADPQLVNQD